LIYYCTSEFRLLIIVYYPSSLTLIFSNSPARRTPARLSISTNKHQQSHRIYNTQPTMHHQLRTIVAMASTILLFGLIAPQSHQSVAMAGVVPGRMLNSNHEEIFAQQAKELERTKSKGRKPVCLSFVSIGK
jgi:hypothetical protein